MTSIRSHFNPDNIEGIRVGDVVYFHVTNLEQDWDVPHGFAIQGAENAELLIMPVRHSPLNGSLNDLVYFQCIVLTSAQHCIRKCRVMSEYLGRQQCSVEVPYQ